MTTIHDLLLPAPIPHGLVKALMFAVFTIHLLFVLLMLGTAILALAWFVHAWWNNRLTEFRWDKKILRLFMVHKSLAVVFGVGPLLLIQVGFSIPFFTAVSLFSPFWLLIIGFLIVAFISFDSLGHRIETHRHIHLFLGMVAIIALLCVPGFFAAVLVAAEHSDKWPDILKTGFGFDWRLSVHWLMRYLHILGASIVFAAAFHYFYTAPKYQPTQKTTLLKWMLGGLLVQIIIGFALYLSLLHKPDMLVITYLGVGIIIVSILIWKSALALQADRTLHFPAALTLLLFLLVSMLLARQQFQDRAFAGIVPEVKQNADQYRQALSPYQDKAIDKYHARMTIIYDNGATIYSQSCAFCHGGNADGKGPDAAYLKIPPADISAIRADQPYLMTILKNGIDGTAMPGFDYYDSYQRNSILEFLYKQYNIFSEVPAVPYQATDQQYKQAADEWKQTCATCHGKNGEVSKTAANFQPPPPDFTQYSLTPDRTYQIITNGYPGTQMASYSQLSKPIRQALVKIVLEKRKNTQP